ncbi:nucleoside-diphosphate kinase [Mesorhizobium sp. LHD-90]|uniref:nucleoside-diphosphate kinase n=1 Tax=Mesorhizobium sp. LHD-90 TaxID=3071414 RepID=UPI0027DEE259|nr:nucleoside-diphosphate kinase [Mesorhizobium sp. LHD-90]MDQ6438032.1 nucleoside-diphosphate kinase [Mesorhizobium sp. LHD-90]
MPTATCILTTKDFTILEIMRDRSLGSDDPLAPILKTKLETATVVFRDDVPVNVATLSSRVTFSLDGRDPDTRILSHDRVNSPGLFLPITTSRGLALLGLAEGEDMAFTSHEGRQERIVLEKVQYQPEAARRERQAIAGLTAPARREPMLRLIRGAVHDRPRLAPADPNGFDDPGPSAA